MKRFAPILLAMALAAGCAPGEPPEPDATGTRRSTDSPEDRFIAIGTDSVHYLDFGGDGLPVILTAGTRPAAAWTGFAPRFTDGNRVLAISDQGMGPEGGPPRDMGNVERRANDIIAFMDALGIERAVVVANSNPAPVLVHLGENHPDRLAGLVFLAPGTDVGRDPMQIVDDPSGASQMLARGIASMQGRDPDAALEELAGPVYTPRYLRDGGPTIPVPTLTFVNPEGSRGIDQVVVFTETARSLADSNGVIPRERMPDSIARTWLGRLAVDEELQAEVRAAWDSLQAPAIRAGEQAFFDAFGDHLRAVPIDVRHVQGYEYRDSPELIEPHIRQFLEEVSR